MAIQRYRPKFTKLSEEQLAPWRDIPPAIVSDMMNRSQVMDGRIKPIAAGMKICGQARTIDVMVGDNGAPHMAIGVVDPGEILVIDAGGFLGTAVWGGIMTRAAMQRQVGGVIVDGAVRDVAEIRELGFPTFSAGAVPSGPHKGHGGVIDGFISCGNCPVKSGDIVLGDDDGVAVVPLERQEELLAKSLEKIAQENETNANTAKGALPGDRLGLGEAEWLD
ncbi:MAG: RraA family protein [Rhodospirillaceae bacterium]